VLIAPDGTAKLTDFGVSVIMTNNADTIEAAGPNDTCAVSLASCPFVMASLVLAPPCHWFQHHDVNSLSCLRT